MKATNRGDSALERLMALRRMRALSRTKSVQAERQIILLSAATAARRAEMSGLAARLLAEVDWVRLTSTLRARRLLPTLGPRIVELAGPRSDPGFAAAVEESLEAARIQGALLQLVCIRAMKALDDAGIPSAALKGPLLAEAVFGDIGRRISNDVDLLVAPERLHGAVEVVREMGYAAPRDYVDASGMPTVHFALSHERAALPAVELHWRTHWYEPRFARERLLPQAKSQSSDWRPAPADELVSLLLFYARDGFVDLRLAIDIGAWWDTFGGAVRPGAVDEVLHVYPALARAIKVSMKVAEVTVGLPLRSIVASAPTLNTRDRMAMRLADPNPTARRSQLYANMGLIDGLLAPVGGLGAFVRRQIFLPREIFDERAQEIPGWRSRSRVGYGGRTLTRYGFAMSRLLRTPEALPGASR
jgi:hypothetical protein